MIQSYRGHPDQRWGSTTYAQHGDDLMLLNLVKMLGLPEDSTKWLWLDLGAGHPTVISNTRLLYDRGWRGVNVDANAELMRAFKAERPFDLNITTGVHWETGSHPFHMFSETSGRNTFSREEAEKYAEGRLIKSITPIECTTVDEVVIEFCEGAFPPLLLIDIEGLDFAVLQSARLDLFDKPLVICVETRHHESERMSAMLAGKGYFQYCRLGENNFYVQAALRRSVY